MPSILKKLINTVFFRGTRRLPSWLRDYVARVRLQDLGGAYHPLHGRMSFNMAVAPEVTVVRKAADKYLRKYQRLRPGSPDASEYMRSLLDESRSLLTKLFFAGKHAEDIQIEFFPGTGRAIEVALQRIPGLHTIILSPFEHYCSVAVGGWLSTTRSIKVQEVPFPKAHFYLPCAEQEKKLV